MKKLYVIGALASLYLAPTVSAQTETTVVADPLMQSISLPAERHAVAVDYNTVSNRVTVFSNDLSDAADWTLDNDDQGTWEWRTETSDLVDQYMGMMASATADNGFMEFNAIQFLFDGPVATQESTFEYTGSEIIDCSALTDVIITFNQRYRAYNVDQTFVEVSNDGGSNWESFQINEDFVTNEPAVQGELSVNITGVAAGVADLKIRFRWRSDYLADNPDSTQDDMDSFGSGYGWSVDDISVSSPPLNELVIGTTWYQNFFEIQEQAEYLDRDLMNAAEYHTQPFHSLRAFNFACIVSNAGTMDQNNVKMVVTVTDVDGAESIHESADGFVLTAGSSDTLRAYDVMPSNWVADATPGTFTIDFEVVQDEEDELPGNNVGVSLFTRISDDNFTGPIGDGGAVLMHSNSNTVSPNTTATNLEDDAIHANRLTFDESDTDRYIVGIQFAIQEETEPGEQILLNVRKGAVTEEDGPGNEMELFFSYDEEELPYITNEDDFTTSSTPVWITYALPMGILIEPNTIYQPEIMLPVVGVPYCLVAATSGRTSTVGVFYYFPEPSTGAQGWNQWSTVEYCLRFVTSPTADVSTGIDDITIENGVKLMQNYPNPFNDVTRIQYQFDETSAASLEVYDMSGKLVFTENLGIVSQNSANSYMFNKGSLASGMYTYSIVTDNNRITRKMTIE